MCWEVNKIEFNDNPEKYHKIADKDIIVYKIGDVRCDKFFTACQIFHYNIKSITKKVELILKPFAEYGKEIQYIEDGYHSYSGDCEMSNDTIIGLEYIIISYIFFKGKKSHVIYRGNPYIGKFIIPKGTEYYENDKGEFVSSQIIWTGESKCAKHQFKELLKDLYYELEKTNI